MKKEREFALELALEFVLEFVLDFYVVVVAVVVVIVDVDDEEGDARCMFFRHSYCPFIASRSVMGRGAEYRL